MSWCCWCCIGLPARSLLACSLSRRCWRSSGLSSITLFVVAAQGFHLSHCCDYSAGFFPALFFSNANQHVPVHRFLLSSWNTLPHSRLAPQLPGICCRLLALSLCSSWSRFLHCLLNCSLPFCLCGLACYAGSGNWKQPLSFQRELWISRCAVNLCYCALVCTWLLCGQIILSLDMCPWWLRCRYPDTSNTISQHLDATTEAAVKADTPVATKINLLDEGQNLEVKLSNL